MKTETKTEKLDCYGTVTNVGTAIVGCMSWETPYVRLTLDDGRQVRWCSNGAADAMDLERDSRVHVQARLTARGTLRNVTLTRV